MAHVKRTLTLSADPAEVWKLIGDFGALADWHPAIAASELVEEEGATLRLLTLPDGSTMKEKLTALDDDERSCSYIIAEGPLPVTDYQSTLLVDDAEGGCSVHWWSDFEPAGVSQEKAEAIIAGVYEAGFDALKKRFG